MASREEQCGTHAGPPEMVRDSIGIQKILRSLSFTLKKKSPHPHTHIANPQLASCGK